MPSPTDSFDTLRDCRVLFLKQLGALLQDCGLLSAAAIQAIQHGAGNYYDKMVTSKPRGSFREEARGMTSSRITLLGDDELELEIRLDHLSSRLFDATGDNLWRIYLRFVTLLKRPELAKTDTPVGPQGICEGLETMFSAAGAVALDKKLALLDRLEASLLQNLPALYAEINAFLERGGIETAQAQIVSAPDTARKTAPDPAPAGTGNALLALQQKLLAQLPGLPPGGFPGRGAGPLSQAALERLVFRLDELDRQGGLAPALRADAAPRLEALIPGLFSDSEASPPGQPSSLHASELGIPASAPEGLAIDTLAAIFEALFASPQLPDALKAVIASLQITLVKIAMQDPGLFTDPAHPARLLLDRMGLAVLGLPADVPARHPVCSRLFEIAGLLRARFTGSRAPIEAALAQVDALVAERNAGIANAAQAYLPLLHQLDRRDLAAQQSRLAIDTLIARGVPAPIRDFLDQAWGRVLQLTWLEHGPGSSQWLAHTQVVDELLWSFAPKADVGERRTLAKRLPEILRLLKTGMDRIGLPADVQTDFLDACFALQTRALRATGPDADDSAEAPAIAAGGLRRTSGDPVAGEIESGKLLLHTLDFTASVPAPARPLPCQPGDWLALAVDGEPRVARLCHLSPASQRALLYNPDSGLALAVHPAILDRQFRDGEASIRSSESLFESAADRASRPAVGS